MEYSSGSEEKHKSGNQEIKEGTNLKIPVIEEQLKIDKAIIEKGKVTLVKKVNEEEVSVDLPSFQEDVTIERKETNQVLDTIPQIRYEGDTIVIPVIKEVMVKQIVLVEEITVRKHRKAFPAEHKIKLRKEEIIINRENKDSDMNS